MTLPKRALGTTGMNLTTVGFGAWAAGGSGWSFSWGPQDDETSIAAMRHAIDSGVNWIDTAAVYGLGHSEEVVGRFLRTLPAGDRPFVFTKCGLEWDPQDPMKVSRRTLHPDSIRRECDASLQRLGIERIDLYQFHWPDERVPIEDSIGALVELQQEGKIRDIGVSNFDAEELARARRVATVVSVQNRFNLTDRHSDDVLAVCERDGLAFIPWDPLGAGQLARGKGRGAGAVARVATRLGATPSQVVLAWLLARSPAMLPIPGTSSVQHLEENVAAAGLRLSSDDLAELQVG
jgi:aryl-alcohol dehydrogenase-like predicted oxidoreductase